MLKLCSGVNVGSRERERGYIWFNLSHKFANQENLKVKLER